MNTVTDFIATVEKVDFVLGIIRTRIKNKMANTIMAVYKPMVQICHTVLGTAP